MDWLTTLIVIIIWDAIRTGIVVYWTALKIRKERRLDQAHRDMEDK